MELLVRLRYLAEADAGDRLAVRNAIVRMHRDACR
jgi:hypothetical protein